MIVLGIETSCDETAAAVVLRAPEGQGRILSSVVLSQDAHAIYGGVVPELAARAHVDRLDDVIATALDEAGLDLAGVDAIAATAGPGLIGGVLVGLTTAKALAMATGKPLVAVNHLEAHALTARLTDGIAFPYLLLLVSGGHTQIVRVDGVGRYRRLGTTIDDALGEAFDKTAKLLDLGYPGGPAVEAAAAKGDPGRIPLPRPMIGRPTPDFSFSGLKTAIRQEAERRAPLSPADVADLCAAFQSSICAVIADRVRLALGLFRDSAPGIDPVLVVAGGVAANRAIAARLAETTAKAGARLVVPPPVLCTDNGAMVAWAGAERLALGLSDDLDVAARARWPLDAEAEPLVGYGRLGTKV
ncbi:tRNA (adenosine(37)-N6)-threonylcarbamoyltransferase complex transferase subunit TsaD [Methylobrevis pamukkalensis]|nr:tRNA (adenosine(37)-N6)-threonylcarbamoyltransferase complex transferase subunit TsaD [Methylobrevis pamukkalensis]